MIRGEIIPPFLNPRRKRRRLERLTADGRTIDIAELPRAGAARVVAIDIRFGTEHWVLDRHDIRSDPDAEALEGGRLVTREGRPVRSSAEVRAAGVDVQREDIRF